MMRKNSKLLPQARNLRKEMTKQERRLWYDFLRHYPIKVYKQRIIDNFIVDFYCHAAKLVIELDGSQHYTENGLAYDFERSAILEGFGLHVLRFTNADVDHNFEQTCNEIDIQIKGLCSEIK